MISAFQVWTSVGTLVGTIVDNFTAPIEGKNSYLIPLGIIYVVPALMSVGLFFIPESPRWLMQHGKREAAIKSLRWLRPYDEAAVQREVADIDEALRTEQEMANKTGIWDMFANPIDRRRTWLAVGAISVQGASGAMYMIAYGTYFFKMANIGNAFENTCILVGVGVAAIIVNSAVITHFGRRRVFLVTGLLICGLTQLLTAVVYQVNPGTESTGKGIVGLSVIYILGYNVSSRHVLPEHLVSDAS
jgi:MFS transporter, SP family, sugar:H+ symporter